MTNEEKIKEIVEKIIQNYSIETFIDEDEILLENCLQEYGEFIRQQTLEEASNILQKEKDTWANQSIGYKAVESVENALQALKDNN